MTKTWFSLPEHLRGQNKSPKAKEDKNRCFALLSEPSGARRQADNNFMHDKVSRSCLVYQMSAVSPQRGDNEFMRDYWWYRSRPQDGVFRKWGKSRKTYIDCCDIVVSSESRAVSKSWDDKHWLLWYGGSVEGWRQTVYERLRVKSCKTRLAFYDMMVSSDGGEKYFAPVIKPRIAASL